ncbi:S-layer homology domain-containing protein [bacterium]|nr:S-layer homology domain-containing protein [bacterium]
MKKFLIGLIALLTASLMQVSAVQTSFPDVPSDHWASAQIKELSEKSVVVGYPDGTFKPDDNVTRAEFASMAIWALGQEHTKVIQPVNFTDIDRDFWAYDMIQRALYFELISCPESGKPFRPDDPVSHEEAVTVIVNALTTGEITAQRAKEVLYKYQDVNSLSPEFLIAAGKAEILDMNVHIPNTVYKLNPKTPATRAEITVLLKNMMEQAKLNPNRKLAEAMRKKTGTGYVIPKTTVKGSFGIIPAGSVIPITVSSPVSSQTAERGQIVMARVPMNCITPEKYILIYQDTDLQGRVKNVEIGKWFVRNGVLEFSNETMTTLNDQRVVLLGDGNVVVNKNWFMKFIRKVFKGEKLNVKPGDVVMIKLTQPLKIDLTNGWIIE